MRGAGTGVAYLLSDIKVQKTKPGLKPVKLTDGGGMFLQINPSGSRLWRYQYRFDAKAKLMALGAYPDVSLAEARERHQDARKLLAKGIDPMVDRKATKVAEDAKQTTFVDIFRLWFDWWKDGKAEKHSAQVHRRVLADIIPAFGSKPVDDVTAADVREMMLTIFNQRGARDVARRAHETTSQIYRYGIAHGFAKRNPAADFKPSDILPAVKSQNFARVDAKELPALLAKMDAYNGTGITKLAMRLLAYTFLRTSELIGAEWSEFDLDAARWDIPKERMKMETPHIVPLSRQAVEVLRALKMLTGRGKLVFPGDLDKNKPMSNNTILKALERMGYKGIMTGHGWRGIASTVLYENGFQEAHVELQLAHQKRDAVAAAYNHAKYLKQRTVLMQWWADSVPSDLELAFAAYRAWGTRCFAELVGDWAIAVWDKDNYQLTLARDYAGVRRLFYRLDTNGIAWCSIIEPLVLTSPVKLHLDLDYIAGCLYPRPPIEKSPYVEIRAVLPSHFQTFQLGGKRETSRY